MWLLLLCHVRVVECFDHGKPFDSISGYHVVPGHRQYKIPGGRQIGVTSQPHCWPDKTTITKDK